MVNKCNWRLQPLQMDACECENWRDRYARRIGKLWTLRVKLRKRGRLGGRKNDRQRNSRVTCEEEGFGLREFPESALNC